MAFERTTTFIKKYSTHIAFFGGLLLIINQVGFSTNIPKFYNSLDTESKILFMFVVNVVITLLVMVYLLDRINNNKEKKNVV